MNQLFWLWLVCGHLPLCRAALPISCPTVAPRPPTLGTQKESHTYPHVTVDCDSLLSPVPSLSRVVVVKLRPDKAQNCFDNLSPFTEQNLNSSRPQMSFSSCLSISLLGSLCGQPCVNTWEFSHPVDTFHFHTLQVVFPLSKTPFPLLLFLEKDCIVLRSGLLSAP